MTPHKQLFRHRPEEGLIGDCWRTCIACLLDMAPADVPHFCDAEAWNNSELANAAARRWLHARGFNFIQYAMQGELEAVLRSVAACAPDQHYLLAGTSTTGCGHSVIGFNDAVAWDPSIDDAGIVGPMSDGYYWLTWLTPSLLGPASETPP
jgi:hypothetical protein